MRVVGSQVDKQVCDICGKNKALTGQGKLFTLAVRSPRYIYRKMICEDCTRLFTAGTWQSRTRKALKTLMQHRFLPLSSRADKLAKIEALVTQPGKSNSLTAQQVWAIINDIDLDVSKLPNSLRIQDGSSSRN